MSYTYWLKQYVSKHINFTKVCYNSVVCTLTKLTTNYYLMENCWDIIWHIFSCNYASLNNYKLNLRQTQLVAAGQRGQLKTCILYIITYVNLSWYIVNFINTLRMSQYIVKHIMTSTKTLQNTASGSAVYSHLQLTLWFLLFLSMIQHHSFWESLMVKDYIYYLLIHVLLN